MHLYKRDLIHKGLVYISFSTKDKIFCLNVKIFGHRQNFFVLYALTTKNRGTFCHKVHKQDILFVAKHRCHSFTRKRLVSELLSW
jgi:hypothetical protein